MKPTEAQNFEREKQVVTQSAQVWTRIRSTFWWAIFCRARGCEWKSCGTVMASVSARCARR